MAMALAVAREPYRSRGKNTWPLSGRLRSGTNTWMGSSTPWPARVKRTASSARTSPATLVSQLRGTPCRVLSKDIKVRSGPYRPRPAKACGRIRIWWCVCGTVSTMTSARTCLLNPTGPGRGPVPQPPRSDRSEKWKRYRTWLPALTAYVLVAQDMPRSNTTAPGRWSLVASTSSRVPRRRSPCQALGAPSRLVEVYDRIVFPQRDTQTTSQKAQEAPKRPHREETPLWTTQPCQPC